MEERKPLEFLKDISQKKGFTRAEVLSLRMKIRNYYRRDHGKNPEIWDGERLGGSFSWANTKEGLDFWIEVSKKIESGGDLC